MNGRIAPMKESWRDPACNSSRSAETRRRASVPQTMVHAGCRRRRGRRLEWRTRLGRIEATGEQMGRQAGGEPLTILTAFWDSFRNHHQSRSTGINSGLSSSLVGTRSGSCPAPASGHHFSAAPNCNGGGRKPVAFKVESGWTAELLAVNAPAEPDAPIALGAETILPPNSMVFRTHYNCERMRGNPPSRCLRLYSAEVRTSGGQP